METMGCLEHIGVIKMKDIQPGNVIQLVHMPEMDVFLELHTGCLYQSSLND